MLNRVLGFVYGMACYLIFFGTFLYAIAFVGDFHQIIPRTIDHSVAGSSESLAQRFVINTLLLSLFAIQHSLMARQWFKHRWTRIIHPLLERSTYVLIASLVLLLVFWQWRPIGVEQAVWDVENSAGRVVLQALFWIGWGIVLISTFLIDHFDLFGLKQSYCYLKGTNRPPPAFTTPMFYRGVRHPLYLGFIIAFWSASRMTMGHLFFAAITTAYMIVAIQFEERDLMRVHGKRYADYRTRVWMLVPMRLWKTKNNPEGVDSKAVGK
jgi:methanethiol S-methyltransferase